MAHELISIARMLWVQVAQANRTAADQSYSWGNNIRITNITRFRGGSIYASHVNENLHAYDNCMQHQKNGLAAPGSAQQGH
jgi:hypothetical protein